MTEFDKLIEKLEYTTIFTKEDMHKAFELGEKEKLKEIKAKVHGMVVNGTIQGIVTEKDLKWKHYFNIDKILEEKSLDMDLNFYTDELF